MEIETRKVDTGETIVTVIGENPASLFRHWAR